MTSQPTTHFPDPLPDGNATRYRVTLPNRPIRIFQGTFLLDGEQTELELNGTIRLTWFPDPTVRFRGRAKGRFDLSAQHVRLRIPTHEGVGNALVLSYRGPLLTGVVRGPLTLGEGCPVRSVRFHLPNFHKYDGGLPIRIVQDDEAVVRPYRLTLRHHDWTVHIDQAQEIDEIYTSLKWYGGYGITHVGVIERHDRQKFSLRNIEEFLACLVRFLTFARGLWCAPIVLEGLDDGGVSWTEWQSGPFASDWQGVHSWFPTEDAAGVQQAFAGFCRLWDQDKWRRVLRESVYWYAGANLNAGAIEGGVVLAHATLERLAWADLGEKAGKGNAPERQRGFLVRRGIPTGIPPGLVALNAWARRTKIRDGPAAVSYIRNKLVHPDPNGRQALNETPAEVRIQARELALWYIELALLSLCGYQGQYVKRVVPPGTLRGAATEAVPWRAGL